MTVIPRPAGDTAPDESPLARATAALRARPERRAVEVADRILLAALASGRRSLPIRARSPHDHVHVADQVLIARLREHIDRDLETVALGRVCLRVTPDGVLERVTVELFVRYGEVILDVADRVRRIVADVLELVLSAAAAHSPRVTVWVHVSDVTRGSPHLVDPRDEDG